MDNECEESEKEKGHNSYSHDDKDKCHKSHHFRKVVNTKKVICIRDEICH